MPHIAPLSHYVAKLRNQNRGTVPEFDPMDGGIEAQTLFLFEKPGPMTDSTRTGLRSGSGFISRDNDDPTAAATFCFMRKAGLARSSSLLWNIVPWWNGTRRLTVTEIQDGVSELDQLIQLLPDLRAIVLVGRKAARGRPSLEKGAIPLFESLHPAPIVRARWPERWKRIPDQWAEVRPFVDPRAPMHRL